MNKPELPAPKLKKPDRPPVPALKNPEDGVVVVLKKPGVAGMWKTGIVMGPIPPPPTMATTVDPSWAPMLSDTVLTGGWLPKSIVMGVVAGASAPPPWMLMVPMVMLKSMTSR
ncbi:hypothetical protein MYIN104542_30370 [Mycobacterium intermedium]